MTANIIVPPNMTEFQFIVLGVTGIAIGKKMKTQTTSRYIKAPMLTKIPKRPRFQRRDGSGSPRKRFRMRQEKDMI